MPDYKKKLEDFINKKSDKQKVIVIYWPTWSWKTDMSINIARHLNTDIISTDSRQIFKYMDIWTWKITEEEKKWVKHHMLDIIKPNEEYSVWLFKKESEKLILELHGKWKIPMLVWWTWLYIDSLIFDFNIPEVPSDLELRELLEKEAKEKWKEFIYKKLVEIDPGYAHEIHPNNLRYVIRAIEVKTITWKSKSDFREEKKLKYDVLFLTPNYIDRENLYNRINSRVGIMVKTWLLDEVKWLIEMWYKEGDFWMKSIWYMELLQYIKWEITLEKAIEDIKQNSRNYAKRQLTWFRKYNKYI